MKCILSIFSKVKIAKAPAGFKLDMTCRSVADALFYCTTLFEIENIYMIMLNFIVNLSTGKVYLL